MVNYCGGELDTIAANDGGVRSDYDKSRFQGQYECQTQQAFSPGTDSWDAGSPAHLAETIRPSQPFYIIHSPGDNWVQEAQVHRQCLLLIPLDYLYCFVWHCV